jgi:hypothetical protein
MFFINNAHNCFCPYVSEEKKKERNPTPQKKIKQIEKIPCTYIILLVGLTSIV